MGQRSEVTCAARSQSRTSGGCLCVFPHYTPAFGTFNHAYRLMKGVRAFMPPQGLLLIAAYMPESWPVRFVDENIRKATAADFEWADVVVVSGMHVQAPQIHDIAAARMRPARSVMLGGPSVSASPEMYPDIDYLHIGEMGDATDQIIALPRRERRAAAAQMRFETKERLPLADFPIPAYDLIPLKSYLMLTLQFSSGCPYLCEFCDIPNLYGRQPRLKTPQQITAELDAMRKQKRHPPVVYFVDDNFIGNRKAAKDMLPHLVAWQKQHGYPLQFACEATLNIAKQPEILALMREASFLGLFVGIETPEADALKAMRKDQNNAVPMMESIKTLNDYGLEVTSGIILGLDTDSDDTEARLKDFIDVSQIPMLTINLLQALPKTPLWDRLEQGGSARRRSDAREQRALPAAVRRGGGDVAALHRLCQRSGAPVRALPPPGRCDLRQPDDPAGARQAQLGQPVGARWCWRSGSCCTSESCRTTASRSGARRVTRCAAARSTPCSAWASSRIT